MQGVLISSDLPDPMPGAAFSRTLSHVLGSIVNGIARNDDVALVRIWLREPAGDSVANPTAELRLRASAGTSPQAHETDNQPGYRVPPPSWLTQEQVQTVAELVLTADGHEIGILAIYARPVLDEQELASLQTWADQGALAIANAQAFEYLQATNARLREENEALRADFRDAFDEAPIPYVHEGLDTRFIRANRAAMRVLGIAEGEIPGTIGSSLVVDTPESQRNLQAALASIGRGNDTGGVILQLRRRDNGHPLWVQWWSKPAAGGGYTRTMLVDITDRVLVEQTKAALEFSLESGQVGDWDFDLVEGTSRRSLRHDQCFGYMEAIQEGAWGVDQLVAHVFPPDRQFVRASLDDAIESLRDWSCEFRVVWPNETVHWLAARGRVYQTHAGRATRMLGIVMDITERKRAEETLRETKAALDFTLESAQVGDWDLDLTRDTSRRSLRHDECFGYREPIPESEWGLAIFIQHVHPDDRARVEGSMRSAVAALVDWSSEFRVVWPDGSVHWLSARGSIYRTTDGKATRMLGIVMDIDERKRVEEALRVSERLARGQVQALTRTLDALAKESAPDRLIEHVLRTTAEQLGAHSTSLWRRDEGSGAIHFELAIEGERLVGKADATLRGVDLALPVQDFWPWRQAFVKGSPALIDDVSLLPPFPMQDHLVRQGIVTLLRVPLVVAGRIEGAIEIRFQQKRSLRTEEVDLAQALANQATLALELTRLSARSRDAAVTAERNRMARDIHDTLAQGFTGVIVQLEAAADARSKGLAAEAETHLVRAGDVARESLQEARGSVRALRPRELDDKDLSEALESLVRRMTAGTTVAPDFLIEGRTRKLPSDWDENLLRIGQEVTTNMLRHARATRFTAQLVFGERELRVELIDDGCGFDPLAANDGFGLMGIGERVQAMGGVLRIRSTPGSGTAISIVLALEVDG